MKWVIELSEHGLIYELRGLVQTQMLANFVAELTSSEDEHQDKHDKWMLSVDGASNIKGSRARVILEDSDGVLVEQSVKFAFKANNNQAEYEALLAGMRLAVHMGVKSLMVWSDSQLVTEQVAGNFQAKDPHLTKYMAQVRVMTKEFADFELVYVPKDQNARADLLSKLASTKRPDNHRSVIQENLEFPSVSVDDVMQVTTGKLGKEEGWTNMYKKWLCDGEELMDKQELVILRKNW